MMRFRAFSAIAFVLTAAAIPVYAGDPPPAISFTVQENSVSATGLSPGGAVTVLNVSLESSGSSSTVTRTWRHARANAEGAITVTFDYPVVQGAFVAVIDVETGRIAKSAGTDTLFEQEELPARRFKRNGAREVDEISSPHSSPLLVVVRPGVGAWLRVAHDGGSGDADGQADGRITTEPSAMQPIGDSPEAPQKIKAKDVVLLVDPACLCFAMSEVAP